jgi:hypothetical protein
MIKTTRIVQHVGGAEIERFTGDVYLERGTVILARDREFIITSAVVNFDAGVRTYRADEIR